MIRSTYRNLMILLLIASFGSSFFVFRKTQNFQLEITARQNDIIRLQQELENTQNLNVALNELDNLTITEQTATQLDILRHLGLEKSNLNFQLESRDVQVVGATSVYIHRVRIESEIPYAAALQLADRLQSTKKIVLDAITMASRPTDELGRIGFNLSGRVYGLEKIIPDVQPLSEGPLPVIPPVAVVEEESSPTEAGISPDMPEPSPDDILSPAAQEVTQ